MTGASSGIGRATCKTLSQLGARLVMVGRNAANLEETHSGCTPNAHRVEVFDLAETDEIPAWLQRLAQAEGPLSAVVHCAGVQLVLPLRQCSASHFDEVMAINVNAAVGLAKGLRQPEVHQKGGSLVLLASVMGLVGTPGRAIYCASKGAIIALTKSLALEMARDNLRVNCVAPAYVKTEMFASLENSLGPEQIAMIQRAHPLGIGEASDVANAIAFLIAESGRWITGSTLVVDGGYSAQ